MCMCEDVSHTSKNAKRISEGYKHFIYVLLDVDVPAPNSALFHPNSGNKIHSFDHTRIKQYIRLVFLEYKKPLPLGLVLLMAEN